MVYFRKANHLIKYDYTQPGYYFVTICCDNKIGYFGQIEKGKMDLNKNGVIAESF